MGCVRLRTIIKHFEVFDYYVMGRNTIVFRQTSTLNAKTYAYQTSQKDMLREKEGRDV